MRDPSSLPLKQVTTSERKENDSTVKHDKFYTQAGTKDVLDFLFVQSDTFTSLQDA